MKRLLFSSLIVAVVLAGCAPEQGTGSDTVVIALDTSDSAVGQHRGFFAAATDDLMSFPAHATLIVYRFDAAPAEAHTGDMPESMEEAAALVKRVVSHRTNTKGTNLRKLLDQIDQRLPELEPSTTIRIYTDCGTELMTDADRKQVESITARWDGDTRLAKLEFIGVRDGHREELREMIKLGPKKFSIHQLR